MINDFFKMQYVHQELPPPVKKRIPKVRIIIIIFLFMSVFSNRNYTDDRLKSIQNRHEFIYCLKYLILNILNKNNI